jgi:hypothetical protein
MSLASPIKGADSSGNNKLNVKETGDDHQDPGPRFPWKAYMKRVREFAEG